MIKKVFLLILAFHTFFLTICATNDDIIGCEIIAAEDFSMYISRASENKNHLAINVKLKGFFTTRKDTKKNSLTLETLPLQETKESKALQGKIKTFNLTKKDYAKLARAKKISYSLETHSLILEGFFPPESIAELIQCGQKLLYSKPYMQTTLETIKKNIDESPEETAKDFKILKKGATKKELEKHFHTTFKNTKKDPKTQCYEETIFPNLGGFKAPVVIGFDEKGYLKYVRSALDKTKITWVDNK